MHTLTKNNFNKHKITDYASLPVTRLQFVTKMPHYVFKKMIFLLIVMHKQRLSPREPNLNIHFFNYM